MRNINICLIALASILFLLINLYGLLEILRYFKLKQLKDLQDRLSESRIRGENNWHTVFTSTSIYEINTETEKTTSSHRPTIEFFPKTPSKPSTPFFETSTTTHPTTTRIRVTTHKNVEPSTVEPFVSTSTLSTVSTTTQSETSKANTEPSTPLILITTKPDWFLDSRQLDEQRRHNAERRRQQLIKEELERRLREEEETKKRLEQEIQERKQKEKEERERIRELAEERRRKEHAEKMEARRIQAIEDAKRQLLIKQEKERIEIEARRRSELERRKLEEKQKEDMEKLRLHEEQELLRKQKLETEQRRLAEQQHREREKLREELRQIELLRRQKLEENEIQEKLLDAEDKIDDGKTIEMSLEEEDDMDLDEHFGFRVTATPTTHKTIETHVEPTRSHDRSEGDWSMSRHRSTTTPSSKDIVETPEPPRNDEVTIVTAFLDIGRGDWFHYQRPLEKYHEFMENLLTLQNNMVIFTDKSSYDFVHKFRKNLGLMPMTKIYMVQFDDLPLSRHLPYAQKIIEDEMNNDELYLEDPDMKNHPEAKSAEYDIVVNSKTYFLYNTTMEDPFDTDFFVWIDAGYGHGNQNVYPYDNVWKPTFPRNKISMIKLTPEHDPIGKYKIDNLYRRNWSVISGGFIAGDKRSIGQLYTVTHNKFVHLIYQNKVDDDQTVMVLAINSYPHLFDIKQGDWFDAFRLYSDPETPFGAKS